MICFSDRRQKTQGKIGEIHGTEDTIVAACAGGAVLMYNPEIVEASGEYQTEESCLSLEGSRACTRYRRIKVAYLDASFTSCKKSFSGFDAQIVQHEIDHCNGVVI